MKYQMYYSLVMLIPSNYVFAGIELQEECRKLQLEVIQNDDKSVPIIFTYCAKFHYKNNS